MKLNSKHKFLVMLALLITAVACKKDDNAGAAIDPNKGTPGKVDAVGGFNVKPNPPTGADYYMHLKGDFDKPCAVSSSSSAAADRDIECILEVEELEGKFHGIEMVLNVPPGMCRYTLYTPYYYLGKPVGVGAQAFVINFDINGVVDAATVSVDGTPGMSGSNSTIATDGVPQCAFNYPGAEQCCMGDYTITTIMNLGDATETPATTTNYSWGGLYGNCIAGAGATMERDPQYGLPFSEIQFSAAGESRTITIPGTISKGGYQSWMHSNYVTSTIPTAMVSPYYEFECFDDGFEQSARIRVQVREWNEMSEFLLKSTGNSDSGGLATTETYWPGYVNDYYDWDDWIALGHTTDYPGMPE